MVLHDTGFWETLRERFRRLLAPGAVKPKEKGWAVNAQAEAED